MRQVNILTQAEVESLDAIPESRGEGGVYGTLTETQARERGWRNMPELPPLADGYERLSVRWTEGDGTAAMAVYVDTLIADRLAAEQAADKARMIALMTPSLVQLAALYRSVLRRVTGDATAETNRSITRESVATIFLGAIANGTMTDELRDAQALLQFGFEWLSPIVAANPPNTWDLPWEVVP
jgi:hypothetical protein